MKSGMAFGGQLLGIVKDDGLSARRRGMENRRERGLDRGILDTRKGRLDAPTRRLRVTRSIYETEVATVEKV
jgi:hypothetical protein